MDDQDTTSDTATVPWIKLHAPNLSLPSPEEIERRRVVAERLWHRREEIGPIGIKVDDIIHELRGGDE